MSLNPITSASFHIEALHPQAYALSVHFLDKNKQKLSEKIFTFLAPVYGQETKIWDVYTHNGSCQNNSIKRTAKWLNMLFDQEELAEVKNVSSHIKLQKLKFFSQDALMATLDLPHSEDKIRYLPQKSSDPNIIQKAEEVVCEFIKSGKSGVSHPAQEVFSLFKTDVPLDFVFCEGSLKKDLLEQGGLTDDQMEYLNSKQGSQDFCACAEYFMTALKLGQSVQGMFPQFNVFNYVKPVSNKCEAFQPAGTCVVFYPQKYQQMYACDGNIVQGLASVYDIASSYSEQTKITTLKYQWR